MPASQATERPIIFSAPMVRAILDGRKTQTRRIIKPQPQPFRLTQDDPYMGLKKGDWCPVGLLHISGEPWPRINLGRVIRSQQVRYAVGMRLWVRETFIAGKGVGGYASGVDPDTDPDGPTVDIIYLADGEENCGPWRPSIHMPRWASRITLEVTSVKVERLQDITEDDAEAEGVEPVVCGRDAWSGPIESHRTGFVRTWNGIYGEKAWLDNPYVIAIRFRLKERS